MKRRYQSPSVQERKAKKESYWFIRYKAEEPDADGNLVTRYKERRLGPSSGPGRITRQEAKARRDTFLATINQPNAMASAQILFGRLVEIYKENHINADHKLAASTRQKYLNHLNNHILPRWSSCRLSEITTIDVEQWLRSKPLSWYARTDIRNIMSGIFTQAEAWGFWTQRNPIARVHLGRKAVMREKRILTQEETSLVLARVNEPYRLIALTALSTGARVSEILGLQWKHVDLVREALVIEQRYWRGDLDQPKSATSHRMLALGHLADEYRRLANGHEGKEFVFHRSDGSGKPLWDSAVRAALKKAAKACGCDFEGLGLHSFRRQNITWRQEAGASAIEASQVAGHATVRMTGEYTVLQLERQAETTRRIQERVIGLSADGRVQ